MAGSVILLAPRRSESPGASPPLRYPDPPPRCTATRSSAAGGKEDAGVAVPGERRTHVMAPTQPTHAQCAACLLTTVTVPIICITVHNQPTVFLALIPWSMRHDWRSIGVRRQLVV